MVRYERLLSVDNPKAAKAVAFGWLNAIHYMAPAETAGVGNMCPWATEGCKALCLGPHSGHAAYLPKINEVRVARTRMFMRHRKEYLALLDKAITRAKRRADRLGLRLCVRLDGATDIGLAAQFAERWPHVQFTDYTKSPVRALRHARGGFPPNVHVTFSRSETNWAQCEAVLRAGGNVAAVFASVPESCMGYRVIDGDKHDLRHLDERGVIVGLSPKGSKAKRDTSGFVIR